MRRSNFFKCICLVPAWAGAAMAAAQAGYTTLPGDGQIINGSYRRNGYGSVSADGQTILGGISGTDGRYRELYTYNWTTGRNVFATEGGSNTISRNGQWVVGSVGHRVFRYRVGGSLEFFDAPAPFTGIAVR